MIKVGEIYETKFNGKLEVVEYGNFKKIRVLFLDTGYKRYCRGDKIKEGLVKDPLRVSVAGIGFLGDGGYKTKDIAYRVWHHMLHRCYVCESKRSKRDASYIKCRVTEEWHNFQNFAKWYHDNKIADCQLDKDLLYSGNTLYAPDTCLLLPSELNSVLINKSGIEGTSNIHVGVHYNKKDGKYNVNCHTGKKLKWLGSYSKEDEAKYVYKDFKESRIKKLAEKHYKIGNISRKVFNILIGFEVITLK